MSHYDDEAQVEQLKRWWHENWKALIGGLVLGLGGILGWKGWQAHQVQHAASASQIYEDLKKAADAKKADEVQSMAVQLKAQFSDTPYAAQAVLRQAALEVEMGKFADAATHLGWVREHSKDVGLQHVATLRQARVLWQMQKADEALKLLDAPGAGSFAALYDELRGDIKLSTGDRGGAAAAYRKALSASTGDAQADHDGLQRKLDDLSDVAQAS